MTEPNPKPTAAGDAVALTRRTMLERAGIGLGWLAFCDLLARDTSIAQAAPQPLAPRVANAGTAKSVIFLFMGGGPSQVDTFDPKPLLGQLDGKEVPQSIAKDVPRIARAPLVNLVGSPYKFRQYGQCGTPVSELFPETAQWVDDLCVIRSCRHETPIHAPAEYIATTGTQIGDRPSLGSWLVYGLGSANDNLPGFVVFNSDGTARPPAFSAGFLPARHQGTLVRSTGGLPNLDLPPGTSLAARKAQIQLIGKLNRQHLARGLPNSELEARIKSYELAFRMQTSAPEVFELNGESQATRALYGLDDDETAQFGAHCLLARRLVERGVRFVQLRNGKWDAHNNLVENHGQRARRTDRPVAALLADLKRRGLLDSTLVVWGGEFGRTPAAQRGTAGKSVGRDHSPSGYTMWLAGGGVRGGQVIGATDPVGYATVERPVHPNDLHATILHALGVDQHQLFFPHNGRRELVTVNGGQVIKEVFAS